MTDSKDSSIECTGYLLYSVTEPTRERIKLEAQRLLKGEGLSPYAVYGTYADRILRNPESTELAEKERIEQIRRWIYDETRRPDDPFFVVALLLEGPCMLTAKDEIEYILGAIGGAENYAVATWYQRNIRRYTGGPLGSTTSAGPGLWIVSRRISPVIIEGHTYPVNPPRRRDYYRDILNCTVNNGYTDPLNIGMIVALCVEPEQLKLIQEMAFEKDFGEKRIKRRFPYESFYQALPRYSGLHTDKALAKYLEEARLWEAVEKDNLRRSRCLLELASGMMFDLFGTEKDLILTRRDIGVN